MMRSNASTPSAGNMPSFSAAPSLLSPKSRPARAARSAGAASPAPAVKVRATRFIVKSAMSTSACPPAS